MYSLDKHEKILALSQMLDQWAEENLDDRPDWKPLQAALPLEWCGGFMWMNRVVSGGVVVELYKHGITRRYLNLDGDGTAYRWTGTGYEPMPLDDATDHVFEELEEMGYDTATRYDDVSKAEKHRSLREAGWTVISVGPAGAAEPMSATKQEGPSPAGR
ncbi:MAG: hypothetical protein ACFCU2_09385 [Acidimicrobiia bacterium]